jgi:phage terminase Nu1 subunit (DNA packaging protein)
MKAKSQKAARIVGINAIAERLKLTPRRIQQLCAEGLPKEKRGRYDVDKVLDWYIARLEKQIAGAADEEGSLTYNKERARDRAAAADLKEIKLAQQRRSLVSISDAEKAMTDLVVSTKAAILAVPGRISQSLVGAEPGAIRDKLEQELKSALQKLSAIRPKVEVPPETQQPGAAE